MAIAIMFLAINVILAQFFLRKRSRVVAWSQSCFRNVIVSIYNFCWCSENLKLIELFENYFLFGETLV